MNSKLFVMASDDCKKSVLKEAKKLSGYSGAYVVDKNLSIGKKPSVVIHVKGVVKNDLMNNRSKIAILEGVSNVVCQSYSQKD